MINRHSPVIKNNVNQAERNSNQIFVIFLFTFPNFVLQ